MFAETDRTEWASGVGAALREFDLSSVSVYLCLNYPTDSERCSHGDVARALSAVAPGHDLQGVVRLADKLDAPAIRAVSAVL